MGNMEYPKYVHKRQPQGNEGIIEPMAIPFKVVPERDAYIPSIYPLIADEAKARISLSFANAHALYISAHVSFYP
jgi:hypothetical protein